MLPRNLDSAVTGFWLMLMIVWIVAAMLAKPISRIESRRTRLTHIVFMAIGMAFLFGSHLSIGLLAWRFVPDSAAMASAGFALTVLGIAFTIWARVYLGGNWSASVAIKRGHQLIRGGPYTIVRHPIYSGLLLAMLGTAIFYGEFRCLVGVLLALAGWKQKSEMEEAALTQEFPAEYPRYRREVKALIPYIL